jgi:hypothetical protein
VSRVLQAVFTVGALLCLVAACANAPRPTPTGAVPAAVPDAFVERVEALALLQTLNADLLSHDSATQTLERWCGDHRLASPPRSSRSGCRASSRRPHPQQRAELQVGPTEQVRYRRVRLRCGALVLVGSRQLVCAVAIDGADERPAGVHQHAVWQSCAAAAFSAPHLVRYAAMAAAAQGWEMQRAASGDATPFQVPDKVLEHRAVLVSPDGMPISEVVETYTGNVLAFLVVNP